MLTLVSPLIFSVVHRRICSRFPPRPTFGAVFFLWRVGWPAQSFRNPSLWSLCLAEFYLPSESLPWNPCFRNSRRRNPCFRNSDPEGPARHLDASRQKLTPHCLAAIFDSQLPSPKLSLKMPPKLPLPHNRGHFFLFQNCPRGEGNCAAIERQKLSRGNFCLAASRCLSWPSGDLRNLSGIQASLRQPR